MTEIASSAPKGSVVGPADLVLAQPGAVIDLQISGGAAATTKLVFSVVGTRNFSWTKRTFIGARIKATRASGVVATLVSSGGQRLYTWRVKAKAGISIFKLPMPKQVRRPGTYTLVWTATAGGTIIHRTTPVKIVGSSAGLGKQLHPTAQPVDVVLTGSKIPKDLALGIDSAKTRLIQATNGDDPFTVTGDPKRNVQVVVVDADQYGLSLVHDLRTVFPNVRLIVLSDDPRKLARAVSAGATLALPRSTPGTKLASVVSRLALGASPG
jgi:hypothetical protein